MNEGEEVAGRVQMHALAVETELRALKQTETTVG